MNNSGSFFTVKNAGIFLLLSSFFLSFTDPKPHFHSIKHLENFFADAKEKSWISGFRRADRKSSIEVPFNIVHGSADRTLLSFEGTSSEVYNSAERQEGVIGTENFVAMSDDPADNIFTVNLPKYDRSKRYILAYSARGVNSASSVTRSINQSYSLGGYISSRGNTWIAIEEEIDPHILRGGTNRILFTTASAADYYAVKDVRIIESGKKRSSFYTLTSTVIAEDKVYLKGFINTTASVKNIEIAGREVALTGNEFEYYSSSSTDKTSFNLKFTKFDGTVVNEQIRAFETGGKAGNVVFSKPEENIIYKDKIGALLGLRRIDLPPVESSITNISQNYSGYRYKRNTDGETPVHLPYDPAMIPKGSKETEISTFKFDYEKKKWTRIVIDSINTEERFVVVTADNDAGGADYINGIIKNPESPETSSFTPTTTNNVPVANPGAKINMISPPVANQQGSANVSYPIEIPAGINGFQPNISIDYNSDSKTGGWAGLGWDVPMETIDIDTRWGVPDFNAASESEIYILNGEQLVFDDDYLPNKIPANLWKERVTSDLQFYFRIGVKEGIKIIRKGSNTANYTWEVTDADGNIKRYQDVLKDSSGNNVRWFLTSVTNKYGHEITNQYEDLNYNGGQNKYLKEINYSSNNTKIEFINHSTNRNDITSSYKLGVKISEFKLLDKVLIKRAGSTIREYQLTYKAGSFEKTVLAGIAQKNASGEIFNNHQFIYNQSDSNPQVNMLPSDEEENDTSDLPSPGSPTLFSSVVKTSDAKNDNISSFSIAGKTLGLMGGSETKSENYRGAITAGFSKGIKSWFLPILLEFDKKGTVGLNTSFSETESLGKTELIDMDGDGLPDKVFYQNNQIKYRKNAGIAFGSIVYPTGLSAPFNKSGGNTSSYGLEMSLKNKIGAGITYSKSRSYVSSYFSDVNADGLPDFVKDKEVYFNRSSANGQQFEYANTTNTPNAILNGVPFEPIITPAYEAKLMSNIVRVWESPHTGVINLLNQIKLEEAGGDGVTISIQIGQISRDNENNTSAAIEINSTVLTEQNEIKFLDALNIPVTKGQRIYIIANANNTIAHDRITINSTVEYISVSGFQGSQLNLTDINNNKYFKFNAKTSYLENSFKGNAVGDRGDGKISWPDLPDQKFSDDVYFKIYKLEKKAGDTTSLSTAALPKLIFHKKLKRGEPLSNLKADDNSVAGADLGNLKFNAASTENDPTMTFLYLDVSSDTNIAWDKIKWFPQVEVSTDDSDDQISNLAVQYQPFSEVVKLNSISPASGNFVKNTRHYPKFTSCYDVKLYIPLSNIDGSEVTFSIKFKNYSDGVTVEPVHVKKHKVRITGNYMEIPYVDNYTDNPSYSDIQYELSSNNYDVAKFLSQINPYIEIISNQCFTTATNIRPNYYSFRPQGEKHRNYNLTMGQMWQGWGAFSYNANNPNYQGAGLRELSFYDDRHDLGGEPAEPACNISDEAYGECMLNFLNGEVKKRYFTALDYNPTTRSYQSPMESTYINGETMLPYAINEYIPAWQTSGEPTITPAHPMAIIKYSEDVSLNLYGRFGPVNGSGGYSRNKSTDTFMDINGDMYPDVVHGEFFQKTDQTGRLSGDSPVGVGNKNTFTETLNIGAGFSATSSITSTKFSNTAAAPAHTIGELVSHTGTSSNAVGFSGNIGAAKSNTSSLWIDINGDGLTDYVKDGEVSIFNGKNFIKENGWNQGSDMFKNQSRSVGGGLGANLWGGSWVMGTGINHSNSRTDITFIDLNGDGLPDKVYNDGGKNYYVKFNKGDGFGTVAVSLGEIDFAEEGLNNRQETMGANIFGTVCLVVFKIKLCVSLGGNKDKTIISQNVDFRDFTGDGLPDIVISDNESNISYIENNAGSFNLLTSITNPLGGGINLLYTDFNISDRKKIGNTYQMPFSKKILTRVALNLSMNVGTSLEDIPELVNMRSKYFDFEYENGIQDRRERTFLGFGKVKTIAGYKGTSQVTEYETNYTKSSDFYVPYNHTDVRKYFYKKGLVKSTYVLDSLGKERQRTNFTYRYFDQSADHYVLTANQSEPIFKDVGRIIPLLHKIETIKTEITAAGGKSKTLYSEISEYDKYGNVTKYSDLGANLSNTSDDLNVSIEYHPVTSKHIQGIPRQHIVTNSAGHILRKSETFLSADNNANIAAIRRYLGNTFAEYNYEYDSNGNLKKSVLPLNTGESEADRMYYKYKYDTVYHTFLTEVSDARNLYSTTTYNYLMGVPTSVTDTNGLVTLYEYDSFGRLTKYRSPADHNWSILLYYYREGNFNARYATTEKIAPTINGVAPTLNYFSSVFVNFFGEEIFSKKLYGGSANNYIYTYSMAPVKDHTGSVTKTYVNKLATQEYGSIAELMKKFNPKVSQAINLNEFKDYYVTYKYDELNRPVKAIQNGVSTNTGTANLTTETQYGFGADRNGNIQFSAKTISPKGIESSVYTDEKGRTTATSQQGDNKTLWTSYTYDLLGQLTEVKDQNSNKTQYGYDQLGRRITETHPDAGTSNYQYDLNSNLISTDNPVLRALNQSIGYTYQFNRLTGINYPDYQVTYEYGGANAADFGAGRLIKLTDHTGIQMFKYSKLGQITENKRFMAAPNVRAKVFKTNFVYDTYNRINKITYPDSEEVYYNYNPFGQLDNIQSKPAGTAVQTPIVYDILYDYNEQTKAVKAGNGTRTIYEYDPWGRLQQLALSVSSGDIRRNSYTFDKDANISSIISHPVNPVVSNGISVATEKSFEYDGFNRLKKSVIKATGTTDRKYYQLDMAYTDMHAIANKDSRWKEYDLSSCLNPSAMGDKMVYHYEDRAHPNAVSSIELKSPNSGGSLFKTPWDCGTGHDFIAPLIKENYTYDANGNMTKVMSQDGDDSGEHGTDPRKNVKRQLFWDAQNRLKGISEGTALHHYVYDEDGQRALKSEGASRSMKIDGNPDTRPGPTLMGPYNYYPNGYMVANDRQISKHYYIGSNKVAARVSDTPSHLFLSQASGELQGVAAGLQTEAEDMAATAGLPAIRWENFVIDDGGISLETEQICSDEVLAQADAFSQAHNTGCFKKIMQGYYTALENNTVCAFWHSFKLDNCMIDQPVEEQPYQTYWVHPDHLSSGSVITNQAGATTNWYEYMPFGEMLMEQSNYEYNNLYKYNGKELDEATGLYYYGARYYDPKTSVWLSVDPLAVYNPVMESEFYGDGQHNGGVFYSGNLSPYIYTYQNPIRYIDPNGKQVEAIKGYLGNLWNDWNPFNRAGQRMAGESERDGNARIASNTIGNINGLAKAATTKETRRDLFNIATRNPDQKLLKLSVLLQDTGDAMSVAGYALTISVAGAEAGVPLAALGNAVSTTGDIIEITVKLSQSDLKRAASKTGWLIAGELIDLGVSKIPGITNKEAKSLRENLSEKILKQNAALKLKVIEKVVDQKNKK